MRKKNFIIFFRFNMHIFKSLQNLVKMFEQNPFMCIVKIIINKWACLLAHLKYLIDYLRAMYVLVVKITVAIKFSHLKYSFFKIFKDTLGFLVTYGNFGKKY